MAGVRGGFDISRSPSKPHIVRGVNGTKATVGPVSLANAEALREAAEASAAAAAASAAAAEAVGATHDAQTAANVTTGPLTGAALAASYVGTGTQAKFDTFLAGLASGTPYSWNLLDPTVGLVDILSGVK